MSMRFRTRAFLLSFIPFGLLLAGSFWMIQRAVQSAVRDGVEASLRENQAVVARLYAKDDLQNSRFLKIAGENSALKAGMQLVALYPKNESARRTVEDQLRDLGDRMGFDFMQVSGPDGTPKASVIRREDEAGAAGQLVPIAEAKLQRANAGLVVVEGRTFHVASVPVDLGEENIGSLAVGEYFSLGDLGTPVALMRDAKVIAANVPGVSQEELESQHAACRVDAQCDMRLRDADWISLPVQNYGTGYVLLSLENVDEATEPMLSRLHRLFWILSFACAAIALAFGIGASGSLVKPIATMVATLRNAASTGRLTEVRMDLSRIREMRELAEIYNRAAVSVRAAGEDLEQAYLEFVGSLANALDARDRYTAGHSRRVSEMACATAATLELDEQAVERIRIGALLHDIGKIGIADSVLQKPGRLTDAEFALVKMHPVIGRRILEGVQGFAPFLGAVELHHENWDGTGYPKGQKREETPIDARIIHVSDAYDAMTTDRSYRRGMTHETAIRVLKENAGTQFDPQIVVTFVRIADAFERKTLIQETNGAAEELGRAVNA